MSAASTGGTEGSSPASSPASATSLTMAAPKYGTLVPNRIFVGGISANTSVDELTELFSSYGTVKATKIIADRAGVSKGYGFVTFETEEEAKRLQQESECIVLKERKLNIAPAIKKQSFNRSFDGGSGSPPSVPTSTLYYTNGMGLAYQNGMTFYNTAAPAPTTPIAPTDPATLYQATGVFGPQAAGHQTFAPVMYPCPGPSLYMPQQYQYPPVPYEPYYAGTAAAGAPPYLYPASNSQNNSNGGGSSPGSGNNGTSATGSATGPPPQPLPSLPPPPPAHFYAPAAPPPHHHPPVAAAAPPPQVDHMYYAYTAGPHPLPPHAPMGLTDQQLPLYTPDTSCQQTSSSDGQTAPQEDTRSTSSHSEQPHGETQAASGSATPLVSLMPVKFPMSGRYTNYHPIAIHTANLYSSQTCLNENDDCSANQMHCRAFVYHPAVYIPHSHTPPFHNASGGTSLLPTPPAISQQMFESSSKSQSLNSKDYMKSGATNAHSNYIKSQNHGGLLPHQSPFSKAQNLGNSQSYKHSSLDGNYKYASPAMSSRLPSQYGKRTAGSGVGSSACYPVQKTGNYGPAQNLPKLSNYGGHMYSPTCTTPHKSFGGNSSQSFEYANGRRNAGTNSVHYFDNSMGARSNRKNSSGSCRNSNSASAGHLDGNMSSEGYGPNNPTDSPSSSAPGIDGSESGNSDKPSSPPPAPYSPMTRPLPTMSPPAPQVQFYAPAQNRYQPSLAPSQHQHQQQQQQQQQQSNQRRYTVGPTLASNRKSMDKYGSGNSNTSGTGSTGSQATMLRQSKYKVNGIMQSGGKVPDDGLGGAGDAPPGIGRMPITPPGTPRTHSTHSTHSAADQNQLNDTCHQMQALSL